MTPIELAVEHELIVAGAWYPGMRAEIVATLGSATDPDAGTIRIAIAEQRKEHPERFLPERDQREIDGTSDPADRYLRALNAVGKTRWNAVRMLEELRQGEPAEEPSA